MNIFGIGTGELLVILVIAMLVVGPEKLADFAKQAGQTVAKLRRMMDDVSSEFREAVSLEVDEAEEKSPPEQALLTSGEQTPAASPQLPVDVAAFEAKQLEQQRAAQMVDGEVEISKAAQNQVAVSITDPAKAPASDDVALSVDLPELVAEEETATQPVAPPEPTIVETANAQSDEHNEADDESAE
jgi:sec-independent protein translocase protein TatB